MQSEKPKLVFHSDPGHGWLEVERTVCAELGILDKITPYSYQNGDRVAILRDSQGADHPDNAGKFFLYLFIKP